MIQTVLLTTNARAEQSSWRCHFSAFKEAKNLAFESELQRGRSRLSLMNARLCASSISMITARLVEFLLGFRRSRLGCLALVSLYFCFRLRIRS